jgi:hypothetical protein
LKPADLTAASLFTHTHAHLTNDLHSFLLLKQVLAPVPEQAVL